ncbi:MAG: sulfurtransferase [Deltaproteobacteria bacterium]|nr:sulfurtransferase [Deltaproteobacteria bacterium]
MQRDSLVTVEWLRDHLRDPEVRVVDCRWTLGQPGEGRRQYEAGHIPGAAHLDVDQQLSGKEGPGRHPIPDKREFQKTLSVLGVDRETLVVAYDGGQGVPAPRLWWLLRYFGHSKVAVLDGGWNRWTQSGGAVEQEIPVFRETSFLARPRTKWMFDKETVDSLREDPEVLLIDARSPERYSGEKETVDPKAGHIPGALNLPFTEMIDPQTGFFLSCETLKGKFEKLAAKEAKTIISYCGSGITACTNLFALHLAGLEGVLYEGSWSEWSADSQLPVAVERK